jgi:hypothetical protein
MNQILTLKLERNVFNAIQHQAEVSGISPEILAANLLKQQFEETFKPRINEAEKEAARSRFESHFGEISLAGEIDIDNESIDADLGMEYLCNHEED